MTIKGVFGASMTERDYMTVLPFLAEWDPAVREKFIEGMGGLWKILEEDGPRPLDEIIGVLIVDGEGEGYDVRVITKELCLKRAIKANLGQQHIDAICSPPRPGTLDVLVLAGPAHAVFGVPVRFAWVPRPGSEDN